VLSGGGERLGEEWSRSVGSYRSALQQRTAPFQPCGGDQVRGAQSGRERSRRNSSAASGPTRDDSAVDPTKSVNRTARLTGVPIRPAL
jgi:hypothetical protein